MTIETIGIDREPLEFFVYGTDRRETEALLLLCLPIAGEVEGTATNVQTFYLTSTKGETAAIKSQIQEYNPGTFFDRPYCFHATVESKSLCAGSFEHPPADSFPYLISQQQRPFSCRATQAKIQLIYRDLDFDPVYICNRSQREALRRGELFDDRFLFPDNPANMRFEQGEYVTAFTGNDRLDPKVVIHFQEIDDRGVAEVTLYTWQEDVQLQANATLFRAKRWGEISPLDGQIHERYAEADFAVVLQILSTRML